MVISVPFERNLEARLVHPGHFRLEDVAVFGLEDVHFRRRHTPAEPGARRFPGILFERVAFILMILGGCPRRERRRR